MLTTRGAGAVTGWAVLLCVGIVSGSSGVIPLLASGSALILCAPLIAWRRGRRARRARLVAQAVPAAVAVGDPCELRIVIVGDGGPPSGITLDRPVQRRPVQRRLDHRRPVRGRIRGVLAPSPHDLLELAGHSLTIAVPTDRRGLVRVGPLRAWAHDPLGLFAVPVATTGELTVVVHPPAHQAAAASAATALPDQAPGELEGLRPYVPGDRLSLLDWRSRAAFGLLVVRQFGGEEGRTTSIVLDDRTGVHRRKDFESLLAALVGLAIQEVEAGRGVEVSMLSGRRLGVPPTSSGIASILVATASLEPRRAAAVELPASATLLTTATGASRLPAGLRPDTTVVSVP